MEKKIELVMNENKSIDIFVNGDAKYTIDESEREISAETIYELIDYKIGDNLSTLTKNEKSLDVLVLTFFKELFDNICERINKMDVDEEDMALEIAVDSNI